MIKCKVLELTLQFSSSSWNAKWSRIVQHCFINYGILFNLLSCLHLVLDHLIFIYLYIYKRPQEMKTLASNNLNK